MKDFLEEDGLLDMYKLMLDKILVATKDPESEE